MISPVQRRGSLVRLPAHLAVILIQMLVAAAIAAPPASRHAFTVADSIEMAHWVDPDDTDPEAAARFNYSPDGKQVAIVERRGNVARNVVIYQLKVYETDALSRFARSSKASEPPRPKLLATFESASPKKGIERVVWASDSKRLAFVGRSGEGRGHVYTVGIDGSGLTRVSPANLDVVAFDANWSCRKVLLTHERPPDWSERRFGYVVASGDMVSLAKASPTEARPVLHYALASMDSVSIVELRLGAPLDSWWGFDAPTPALSPDCSRAVIHTGLAQIPQGWRSYDLSGGYKVDLAVGTDAPTSFEELRDNEAFGRPAPWIGQFQLVDTASGKSAPLIDAPSGFSFVRPQAHWLADGSGVVVGPTYLPIDREGAAASGSMTQTIAYVDLRTGKAKRIAPVEDGGADGKQTRVIAFAITADGRVTIDRQASPAAAVVSQRYSLNGDNAPNDIVNEPARRPAVRLQIRQDMNTPPFLLAIDPKSGRERSLGGLNPQLAALQFGTVATFEWRDKWGRDLRGGIVYPPGFRKGERYPVVIQTYGFRPELFLVDGNRGQATAYAAQPLANRGLLVLQMPGTDAAADARFGERTRNENDRFLVALEGAIDALDALGLIDRGRVGLVGFSREGMHVDHFITFSRYPIAAALISDSAAASPFCYAQMFGQPFPGMADVENEGVVGAHFWGKKGIERWLEKSYIFHLDQVTAPLRLEHIGTSFVPCHWDAYALLKRHERPVEMIHIPADEHLLHLPATRLVSQGGAVDWFDFWLNGHEDPSAAKHAQYRRWRKLRAQRDEVLKQTGRNASTRLTAPR